MFLGMGKSDNMRNRAWIWLWLSILVVVLDQGSKFLAVHYLVYGKPIVVLPFFNLWLNYNTGAAFGFLGAQNGWQVFLLSGIAIIVSVVLIMWLGKTPRKDWLMALALSLILGGAIGNLIDRIRFKYVIDFFDFHIGTWHFATFNVSDIAITIGAIFLVIRLLFIRDK